MIVKCEQCQTRFKIPDEKVTDKGVKVRCTKCGHTFRVTRESAADATGAPAPGFDPFEKFGPAPEPKGPTTSPGFFAEGVEATRPPAPPPAKPPPSPWNFTDSGMGEEVHHEPTRVVPLPVPPEAKPPVPALPPLPVQIPPATAPRGATPVPGQGLSPRGATPVPGQGLSPRGATPVPGQGLSPRGATPVPGQGISAPRSFKPSAEPSAPLPSVAPVVSPAKGPAASAPGKRPPSGSMSRPASLSSAGAAGPGASPAAAKPGAKPVAAAPAPASPPPAGDLFAEFFTPGAPAVPLPDLPPPSTSSIPGDSSAIPLPTPAPAQSAAYNTPFGGGDAAVFGSLDGDLSEPPPDLGPAPEFDAAPMFDAPAPTPVMPPAPPMAAAKPRGAAPATPAPAPRLAPPAMAPPAFSPAPAPAPVSSAGSLSFADEDPFGPASGELGAPAPDFDPAPAPQAFAAVPMPAPAPAAPAMSFADEDPFGPEGFGSGGVDLDAPPPPKAPAPSAFAASAPPPAPAPKSFGNDFVPPGPMDFGMLDMDEPPPPAPAPMAAPASAMPDPFAPPGQASGMPDPFAPPGAADDPFGPPDQASGMPDPFAPPGAADDPFGPPGQASGMPDPFGPPQPADSMPDPFGPPQPADSMPDPFGPPAQAGAAQDPFAAPAQAAGMPDPFAAPAQGAAMQDPFAAAAASAGGMPDPFANAEPAFAATETGRHMLGGTGPGQGFLTQTDTSHQVISPTETGRARLDIPPRGGEMEAGPGEEFGQAPATRELIDLPAQPAVPPPSQPQGPNLASPAIARPAGRPADMGIPERRKLSAAQQVTGQVAYLTIAAGLLLAMAAVGGVYMKEGRVDANALSPGELVKLVTPSDYVAHDVSNGLYDTRGGGSVFYVRGEVENRSSQPVRLKVNASLYDGSQRVKSVEGLAGGVPTPEELHAVNSTEAAEKLRSRLDAAATVVAPGQKAPFALVFQEFPQELNDFRLKLTMEPAAEETAKP